MGEWSLNSRTSPGPSAWNARPPLGCQKLTSSRSGTPARYRNQSLSVTATYARIPGESLPNVWPAVQRSRRERIAVDEADPGVLMSWTPLDLLPRAGREPQVVANAWEGSGLPLESHTLLDAPTVRAHLASPTRTVSRRRPASTTGVDLGGVLGRGPERPDGHDVLGVEDGLAIPGKTLQQRGLPRFPITGGGAR